MNETVDSPYSDSPYSDTQLEQADQLWREQGALMFQRCKRCAQIVFYCRSACPHCWSMELTLCRAKGAGVITTFTKVYKGLAPEFAQSAPILLAEIELDEGIVLIARVLPHRQAIIRIGARVRTVGRDAACQFSLPTFELDSPA